jgi:hypothetical protein
MTAQRLGLFLLAFAFAFLLAQRLTSFFLHRYWRARAVAAEELLSLAWHRDFMLTRVLLNSTEAQRLIDSKLVRIAELKAEIEAIHIVISLIDADSVVATS